MRWHSRFSAEQGDKWLNMKLYLLLFCALLILPSHVFANGQDKVMSACAEGKVDGDYRLLSPQDLLRISGNFKNGKKNGLFSFYSSSGSKLAEIPYIEDVIDGTVSLWKTNTQTNKTPKTKKTEVFFVSGKANGVHRSWNPDGSKRTESKIDQGQFISGVYWDSEGLEYRGPKLKAFIESTLKTDERFYIAMGRMVMSYLPSCL